MQTLSFKYTVDGNDFTIAGEASANIKKTLKQLGMNPDIIRNVAIAVYEGEINLVIHAKGGEIFADISSEKITVKLCDNGPGIPDIEKAMQAGYSTADEKVRELGFGAGMGLPNMKKYSDEMTIESEVGKGTTILMTFHIK